MLRGATWKFELPIITKRNKHFLKYYYASRKKAVKSIEFNVLCTR